MKLFALLAAAFVLSCTPAQLAAVEKVDPPVAVNDNNYMPCQGVPPPGCLRDTQTCPVSEQIGCQDVFTPTTQEGAKKPPTSPSPTTPPPSVLKVRSDGKG